MPTKYVVFNFPATMYPLPANSLQVDSRDSTLEKKKKDGVTDHEYAYEVRVVDAHIYPHGLDSRRTIDYSTRESRHLSEHTFSIFHKNIHFALKSPRNT